jgi:hypothetical protein
MEKKVLKNYVKGQKSFGQTNWSKVLVESDHPKIDEENPDLVGKKQFKKIKKN